jgi:hypothetical protein
MISASKNIATTSKRKRQLSFVEISMYVIKKSISRDPKVMKKLQDSQFKKETVSPNSCKVDGLTLLESFTLIQSNTHGGACEPAEGQKILVGDLTIF